MKKLQDVLIGLWLIMKILFFILTHPWWTIKVWRGYWVNRHGAFLDMDFYELTMGQFIWRYGRNLGAAFALTQRKKLTVTPGFGDKLRKWVDNHARYYHSITPGQAKWLKSIPYMNDDYVDYLVDETRPKLVAEHVHIKQEGDVLTVDFSGPVMLVSWWEERIMYAISQIQNEELGHKPKGLGWILRAARKGWDLKRGKAPFSEFGTRRRFSFFVQFMFVFIQIATGSLKGPKDKGGLIGTSNVLIAYITGLTPMGTMAHKLFLIFGAVYGFDKANALVIRLWREMYVNSLGYLLPDTFTTEKCLAILTHDDARFFTGFRQDSGDPVKFIKKIVAFYRKMGLNAKQIKQKTIIFSDGLEVGKALEIAKCAAEDGIGFAFGIGTNFTNDVGWPALNIVVKPYEAWIISPSGEESEHKPTAKISDIPGKVTGDPTAAHQIQLWLDKDEVTWTPLLAEFVDPWIENPWTTAAAA